MIRFRLYTLLCLVSLAIVAGCSNNTNPSFRISGQLSPISDSHLILSVIDDVLKKKTSVIDTITVQQDGSFDGVYFLDPHIYNLSYNNKQVQLAIEKGQHLEVTHNNEIGFLVKGSPDTQLLLDYESFRKKSLDKLVNSIRKKIRNDRNAGASADEIAVLRTVEVGNYKKHIEELTQFIADHMGSSIAIYPTSLRWNNEGENFEIYKKIVSDFEIAHPKSSITTALKSRVETLDKTRIGGELSSIEMPNQFNEVQKLIPNKSKYTLVDFWASWCPPCRSESPILNDLYTNLNSKGFEIYGVSLDSKRKNWVNAIEKDQRSWTNVSTVEGLKTPVALDLGITSLPTNFIVNSDGEIVASNLHGQELKEKVESLFK